MGLRDDILNDLTPEMDGDLADAVEVFTATRKTSGWDTDNNKPLPESTETYSGRGFFLSFNFFERQNLEIKQGDVKYIILSNSTDKIPLMTDKIQVKGKNMKIILLLEYPADVGYSLQLREIT